MFGLFKKNKKLSMKRNIVNNNCTNVNNVRNTLSEGDEGEDVEKLQNMLMSIVHIYPTLPVVTLDGKYNSETRNAVETFQNMMGISKTGIVDGNTWDRLKLVYSKKDQIKAIEKIDFVKDDLRLEQNEGLNLSDNVLKEGSKGRYVFRLQEYLRKVALVNTNIPNINLDGIFGNETKKAVMAFQKEYSINVTGIVDEETWDKLYNEYMK